MKAATIFSIKHLQLTQTRSHRVNLQNCLVSCVPAQITKRTIFSNCDEGLMSLQYHFWWLKGNNRQWAVAGSVRVLQANKACCFRTAMPIITWKFCKQHLCPRSLMCIHVRTTCGCCASSGTSWLNELYALSMWIDQNTETQWGFRQWRSNSFACVFLIDTISVFQCVCIWQTGNWPKSVYY